MHKNQKMITLADKPADKGFTGRFRPKMTELNYSILPVVEVETAAEQEAVQDYQDYLETKKDD